MSWNENVHCTRLCRLEGRQQKASEARSQYQFHIISGQQLLQTSITPTRTTFSWNTKLVFVSAFIFAYSANPHVFSISPPSYFHKQQVSYKCSRVRAVTQVYLFGKRKEKPPLFIRVPAALFTHGETFAFAFESDYQLWLRTHTVAPPTTFGHQ